MIARAKSHPFEAGESYFVTSSPVQEGGSGKPSEIKEVESQNDADNTIFTYKPLHAMLKYDPPLEAVEAVLNAHPYAVLDMTFEGSALKIATESKVSTMSILRLLLVAEMVARRRAFIEQRRQRDGADAKTEEDDESFVVDDTNRQITLTSIIPDPTSPSQIFVGHNPIRWIAESHISRTTAALLLKWYPVGAFQRPCDEDGAPFEEIEQDYQDEDAMYSDSPLIEIIDDFARDQDPVERERENAVNDESESEEELDELTLQDHSILDEDSNILPRRRRTFAEKEYLRKERRWEKFLHILYATDKILTPMGGNHDATSASSGNQATDTNSSNFHQSANSSHNNSTRPPEGDRFHPVHALIRVITNPNLGIDICRPYGVWCVLRTMGQRIPYEFTARDESDRDRTIFQILAESPAANCRLCVEEIRDVVECLMDADVKSAYSPRKSDGRLIVHVALQNGWPCRDLFSRKSSATCA